MTDDQLKELWHRSSKSREVVMDMPVFIMETQRKAEKLEQDIVARDRREIVAASVLIPVFAVIAYFITPVISRIGALLVIPYAWLVIYMLRKVKKYKVSDYTLPLKDYLVQQRRYLYKEMKLLDNVLYWYLLPVAIPLLLFFIGLESYWLCAGAILLLAVVYYVNKQAVKEVFRPLITEVDEQIEELERES